MKRTRLMMTLMALVLVALAPRPAYAHAGWWDWIEELSGPGPFKNGWMFDVRPLCLTKTESPAASGTTSEEQVNWYGTNVPGDEGGVSRLACLTNRKVVDKNTKKQYSVAGYVEVRGGWANTSESPLFSDRPTELIGTARVTMVQGFAMRQFHPAVAVGVGAGLIRFSGDNIPEPQKQFVLTPLAVAISPLKLFLPDGTRGSGFVTLRFDELLVHGHLTAKDFNPTSTSAFESKYLDAVRSIALTFDLLAFKN